MGYVLSFDAIQKAASELKLKDTIVLTHGAFDLFHIGQLKFLKSSKKAGDILIVGIDCDEVISMYKGTSRPIIPLEERVEIISKLAYVDFVFPLPFISKLDKKVRVDRPSDYHMNIYRELSPNIVTYGRQYGGMETIKKATHIIKEIKFKHVIDNSGKPESTTNIINRILASR